ncbi:Cmx/CmrA family chloramphenicol efflux MFS transporter [Streptomyces broussonetiae]|uniref:Cmx/CmrA family chloramphenicol efflux MFS transporter n=1 Tax=Streptomyces broussonetiae TaxID=2686304 RepID=A0A6I6N997_9ACTN|nr:Cmx/CmrA family chloramphenicol efflux MFS transporter [Streptomyces broussonetiae]QHA07249.1 Cmx/CmrA family chloramphenicol efflux MFS transporter [Streptomyces broussonetiae]
MPIAVYVLGLTVFCIGTTEFMISGLLPDLAGDLSVSIPAVGWLISGYALGVVVGGPAVTLATLRVNRKTSLLGLLALFVAGQTVCALAPSYDVLMSGRVVAALAQGAFFGIGSVVAVDLAGPERRGRALAIMFAGLTVANVVGVPAGTFLSQHAGWRVSFWAVDALAVVGLLGVAVLVPRRPTAPYVGIGAEFRAFRNPRVWVALSTSMLTQAAVFCCFSYLSPLFTDVTGFSEDVVPLLLALFGAGCFLGSVVGGRFADRYLLPNLYTGITAMGVVLVLIPLAAHHKAVTVVAIAAFGVAAFSINPALQAQVMREAGDAPTLATTTNTSAFNLGNTIGPWIGGSVIDAGFGFTAPSRAAALLAAAGLVAAVTSGLLRRRADLAESGVRQRQEDAAQPSTVA